MELTESQKNIIETENRNILVSASAGSGKTFVVIQRILAEVISKRTEIDKLLVVTFTNAAASELKERLTKKLYEYLDSIEKNREERKYILKQINKILVSNISTIHAFCLSVIKDNFYLIGTNPTVNIMDDANSKLLMLESIIETIEEEYEKEDTTFIDMLTLFKSEDNLAGVLNDVYRYYLTMPDGKKWLSKVQATYDIDSKNIKDLSVVEIGQGLINIVKDKLNLMEIELDNIIEKIEGFEDLKTRRDILENMKQKVIDIKGKEKFDDIYLYISNMDLSTRLPSSKVSCEDLKEEIKNVKNLVTKQFKEISKIIYRDSKGIIEELNLMCYIIKYICNMIINIDKKYSDKKSERGVIDFSDIEHLTLKILEDENVCKIYREKFDEIYIDEYQDNSVIQESIINRIKKENNVIMVGDVKQSIYGFRHAKPEIFVNKYLTFKDINENEKENINTKIILDTNFRSRKEVIDSTNYIFEKSMTSNCGGIDYKEKEKLVCGIDNNKSKLEDEYITEINIVETNKEESEEKEEDITKEGLDIEVIEDMKSIQIEARAVAEKIKEIVEEDSTFKVQGRKCTYKDIVILMRAITSVSNIVEDELKKQNIPVYSDSGIGFFKGEEITLVINFLKLLNNRYDDITLASVMYGIIGCFSLDELAELRVENTNMYLIESIYEYMDKGANNDLKEKLTSFISFLDKYEEYLNIYSISEIIVKLYEQTGLYDAMLLEENSVIKRANLDAFIDIVNNYEEKETSSLITFLNYVDSLSKKGGNIDTPKILGENENVVRIMTIHKSKGLEFPVVILMNTNKKYNELDTRADLLKDEDFGVGINILNKEYNICYPSAIKQVIKSKIKATTISEEMRLLYVAMTRAKDKLYIYGAISNYEKFIGKLMSSSESTHLTDSTTKNSNSYLKLIMEVLNLKGSNIPFNVNILNAKDMLFNTKNNENDIQNIRRGISVEEILEKSEKNNNIDKEYLKKLQKMYNISYPYLNSLDIKQKYTATELKQKAGALNEVESVCVLKDLKPNILEERISETTYGTFIHKVVENITMQNISKENIEECIKKQASKLQNKEDINISRVETKIVTMLNNIKEYINGAKEINREYEFVINDNLEDIEDLKQDEKTLIQGVIDLYIVTEDGKNIIIDYKTDRVENESELIDKYKYQLYVYKRAIELSREEKVENMYIYSFYLDKLIEVK